MSLFRSGLELIRGLIRYRPLRKLRSGALVAFSSEIGFVRYVWLVKVRKASVRAHGDPDRGTQELSYSQSFLSHYSPDRRVRWTMGLLAAIPDCPRDSLLIIGPRYEPEILMAYGLGWTPGTVRGLDTFSYSPLVDVGDMHALPYADGSFSAIVCGWTLSYSTRPEVAAAEMQRVLRPGGYLIVSMQKVADGYSDVLEGVLTGRERIQTLAQLDSLYSGLERVAGFEPHVQVGGEGHTIAAYRKGR